MDLRTPASSRPSRSVKAHSPSAAPVFNPSILQPRALLTTLPFPSLVSLLYLKSRCPHPGGEQCSGVEQRAQSSGLRTLGAAHRALQPPLPFQPRPQQSS